ncbi:MAG: hypothetical protein HQM16_04955 [Deltaproteobacteria bacterium]|nr:hypothetical protein [Deltaproteobacteria bacterium]
MLQWIQTADGSCTLFSEKYQETYHSRSGAWAESQEVFLRPFLAHQTHHWRVLDIGFGLGLNWLCYVNAFLHEARHAGEPAPEHPEKNAEYPLRLDITSLDNDPEVLHLKCTQESLGCFPVLNRAFTLLDDLKVQKQITTDSLSARLIIGEAKEGLKELARQKQRFNVILQDPFSPKKNPDCWDENYFDLLAPCCETGCLLLTYSVAKAVRNNLERTGFTAKKIKGFGSKREQLVAIYQP